MTKTDENSARAVANTHPAKQPVEASTDLIKEHVRLFLEEERRRNERRRQQAAELERTGHRLIDGGQVSMDGWEIRDWRTNALLAAGDDGIEGYEAALARLDPDENWFHIDRLYDEVADEVAPAVSTPGIPPSLSQALQDAWLGDAATPDEEIAQFIDWPVEQVRECRRDIGDGGS